MAYKLKEGKEYIYKGMNFVNAVGVVKTVILDRESKTANIIFKTYADNSKIFELENANINVSNRKETVNNVESEINDYDTYFEQPNGEGHSAMTLLKIWAYRYINDKKLNIGNFIFENWQSDEM